MPKIFPDSTAENLVICVSGIGARSGFSALMVNEIPNLHTLDTGQCFPLYLYDEVDPAENTPDSRMGNLFTDNASVTSGPKKRYALTDDGLEHFRKAYPDADISKEDVFNYVYGLLHSPEYRECYADNLSKELPRIPRVKSAADFLAFSKAGRKLADLHLNYETVEPYPVDIKNGGKALTDADYRVEKIHYSKNGKEKDLTTLHYNDKITLSGIPLDVYDYVVNGKPALNWVVERQCVKTDKDSGIINDANDWAIGTMNSPRYPLELVQRMITVSLESMKIIRALPKLGVLS